MDADSARRVLRYVSEMNAAVGGFPIREAAFAAWEQTEGHDALLALALLDTQLRTIIGRLRVGQRLEEFDPSGRLLEGFDHDEISQFVDQELLPLFASADSAAIENPTPSESFARSVAGLWHEYTADYLAGFDDAESAYPHWQKALDVAGRLEFKESYLNLAEACISLELDNSQSGMVKAGKEWFRKVMEGNSDPTFGLVLLGYAGASTRWLISVPLSMESRRRLVPRFPYNGGYLPDWTAEGRESPFQGDLEILSWAERCFVSNLGENPVECVEQLLERASGVSEEVEALDDEYEGAGEEEAESKDSDGWEQGDNDTGQADPDEVQSDPSQLDAGSAVAPEPEDEFGSAMVSLYGLVLVGVARRDYTAVERLGRELRALWTFDQDVSELESPDLWRALRAEILKYEEIAKTRPSSGNLERSREKLLERLGVPGQYLLESELRELAEAEWMWPLAQDHPGFGLRAIILPLCATSESILRRTLCGRIAQELGGDELVARDSAFTYMGQWLYSKNLKGLFASHVSRHYPEAAPYLLGQFRADFNEVRTIRNRSAHDGEVSLRDATELRAILLGTPTSPGMLPRILALSH